MFYKFLIFISICLLISSCETREEQKSQTGTWLGGQIINPVGNTVTIRKDDLDVATLQLDRKNRFLHKFTRFEPGLYEFVHKERQLIYLNKGDSLIFRVNTLEYDESLSFTGYGADKNNLLLHIFLRNERENEHMARAAVYKKNPKDFQHYLDSLQRLRNDIWSAYEDTHPEDKKFAEVAHALLNYDIYARKEVYPLTNFVSSKFRRIQEIPKKFYKYRSSVSFNQENLLPVYSYQRFLFNYFNQASYKKYARSEAYDTQSYTHNAIELKLIDSIVKNKRIKSFLMTRNIRNFLVNSNDREQATELFTYFMQHVPDTTAKREIRRLYDRNKKIEAGKTLPNDVVMGYTQKKHKLLELIHRPSVLYFWSSANGDHMIRSHIQAKKIRNRYPQYDVIAINIDPDKNTWLQTLEEQGFEKEYAYHFEDVPEKLQEDFSLNAIMRTIIIDEKGKIFNAHANMFSSKFENQLLGYLNKTE